MPRLTAAPRRPRRLARLALVAALGAAAALLAAGEARVRAAPALTVDQPMAIDGGFADWDAVLANALQTTRDGDGSSYTQAQCAQFSTDRDCSLSGGAGNDFLTFAWTYDASNVYLYVERYGSPTNGVDLLFVADVNRDKLLTTSDRVVHARWSGQTGTVTLDWSRYEPAPGSAGDPIVCAPVAPATHCLNPAGVLAAPAGYVDGYKLPGSNPEVNGCAGCAGVGNTTAGHPKKGLQVEVAIPWTVFGVPAKQPFYWHVVSANNPSLVGAVDNIGAPNGMLGSFSHYAVSLFPDRSGSVAAGGQRTYVHTLRNDGNDADVFDLVATSSQGAKLELLEAGAPWATDLDGDGAWDSIASGGDANGDGRPDVSLDAAGAPGASRDLSLRLTMPADRTGVDVTRLTAVSAGDPLVSASVSDTSQLGTVSFLLPAQAGATVADQPLPFREQLQNAQGVGETFDLVAGAGCGPAATGGPGFRLELAQDAGGPGAVVAVDETGDGSWDSVDPAADTDGDLVPDLGEIPAGETKTFHLLVTPPPGTAAGTACTVELAAAGAGVSAIARHHVTAANPLTFGPSYRGTQAGVRDAADAQVAVSSSIFLPVALVNAESADRAYDLTVALAGPADATARVWSDPNGDGNPSDGQLVATAVAPAWGGAAHLVVEVRAGATRGFAVGTVTARATAGGAEATQVSEVVVGYLGVYADALHLDAASAFAPCDTVYVGARGLVPSDVTRYALQWVPPSGAAPAGESPWPTTAIGTADAELALPAEAALGDWTTRLLDRGTSSTIEELAFSVSRVGTIPSFLVDRTRYARGDAVVVAAEVANGGAAALRGSILVYSGATSRTLAGVDVLAGGTRSDAFTFRVPDDAPFGPTALSLGWQLSCATAPFVDDVEWFDVVPAPPTVTVPAADAALSDATPTVEGTAAAGASVVVEITGAPGTRTSPTLVADAEGRFAWTVPDAEALADGAHEVTATQALGGVASDASVPVSFTVDTAAPAAPTLDDVATPTRAEPVLVSGRAAAGGLVTLFLDGAEAGTATAAPNGTFSAELAGVGELPAPHALYATVRDAAGNGSLPSETVSFTVDRTRPGVPSLGVASPTSADPVVVTVVGAEADATVTFVLDGAAAGAVVAPGGPFVTALDGVGELPSPHVLGATVTDAAGNVSDAASVMFVVDRTLPESPVLDDVASPTAADPVVVTGGAERGADVLVTVDGALAATVAADGDSGAFSASLPGLAPGTHYVSAEARDAAGNVGPPSATLFFTVDRAEPAAPWIRSPAQDAALASGSVAFAGTAEAGATVTVTVGTVTGSTTVTGTGDWALSLALADGSQNAVVVATDAAGNGSDEARVGFAVDTVKPAPPTIDAPTDGAVLAPGAIRISGSAEAGAAVTVTAGAVTAAATAAGDQTWSVDVTLPEDTYEVTAVAADAAGNVSDPSGAVTVVVRTEGGGDGGGGCGCRSGAGGGAPALLGLAALLVLAPRRRRRS